MADQPFIAETAANDVDQAAGSTPGLNPAQRAALGAWIEAQRTVQPWLADDHQWFADHPGVNFRLRPAFPGEFGPDDGAAAEGLSASRGAPEHLPSAPEPAPAEWRFSVVHQIRPGLQCRNLLIADPQWAAGLTQAGMARLFEWPADELQAARAAAGDLVHRFHEASAAAGGASPLKSDLIDGSRHDG